MMGVKRKSMIIFMIPKLKEHRVAKVIYTSIHTQMCGHLSNGQTLEKG